MSPPVTEKNGVYLMDRKTRDKLQACIDLMVACPDTFTRQERLALQNFNRPWHHRHRLKRHQQKMLEDIYHRRVVRERSQMTS